MAGQMADTMAAQRDALLDLQKAGHLVEHWADPSVERMVGAMAAQMVGQKAGLRAVLMAVL